MMIRARLHNEVFATRYTGGADEERAIIALDTDGGLAMGWQSETV